MASGACPGCGGDNGGGSSLYYGSWLPMCDDCILEMLDEERKVDRKNAQEGKAQGK